MKSRQAFALPTRNSPELLPAVLCVALFAGLLLQAVLLWQPFEPDVAASPPHRVHFLDTKLATDYPGILQAPLFSMGRQPIVDATQPVANSIDGAQVQGIGLDGADSVALVRNPDGSFARVHAGQEVAGWKLVSIARDTLTFTRGGEQRVMTLSPAPPAAPVAQPAGAKPAAPADSDDEDNSDDGNNGGDQ